MVSWQVQPKSMQKLLPFFIFLWLRQWHYHSSHLYSCLIMIGTVSENMLTMWPFANTNALLMLRLVQHFWQRHEGPPPRLVKKEGPCWHIHPILGIVPSYRIVVSCLFSWIKPRLLGGIPWQRLTYLIHIGILFKRRRYEKKLNILWEDSWWSLWSGIFECYKWAIMLQIPILSSIRSGDAHLVWQGNFSLCRKN